MGGIFSKSAKQRDPDAYVPLLDSSLRLMTPSSLPGVKRVVLCGGGMKGLAHLGALSTLDLSKIKAWAGASAGAILVSLLALGWSCEELIQVMIHTDFRTFLDEPLDPIHSLYGAFEVWRHEGINSGHAFYTWLGQMVERAPHSKENPNVTFEDLWMNENVELCIMTTDVWGKETFVFSHDTTPFVPIRIAVRASMSIPFLFRPVCFTEETGNQRLLVDGGLLDNFPIDAFPSKGTLGILLETTTEVHTFDKREDLASFGMDIANTWQSYCVKHHACKSKAQVLRIKVPHIPLTTFHLDVNQKKDLLERGRQAGKSLKIKVLNKKE